MDALDDGLYSLYHISCDSEFCLWVDKCLIIVYGAPVIWSVMVICSLMEGDSSLMTMALSSSVVSSGASSDSSWYTVTHDSPVTSKYSLLSQVSYIYKWKIQNIKCNGYI